MNRVQGSGGSLYKRGRIWWIKYYVNGRPYRESTKTNSSSEAKRLLVLRLADGARGHAPDPRMRKLTVSDLVALVTDDYQINGRKSLDRLQDAAAHLSRHFGGQVAMTITPADIKRYIVARQKAGAANSTINRELGARRRGFRLGAQAGMLPSIPPVRMLRERVRTGFFEPQRSWPCAAISGPTSKWRSTSPTPSAGGCRAKS